MKRTAFVTGGGRGIGRGIALALAEKGWEVAINFRSNEAAADETKQIIEKAGGICIAIKADLAKKEDRDALVGKIFAHFNHIDLLVNNAGMSPRQRTDLLKTSEVSYDEIMEVNLKGPFFLTQQVANKMIDLVKKGVLKTPKIVNISSISAYTSSFSRAEYCLSKAGVSMMTQLFADRLAEHGIGVFEIRPGIIETDMTSTTKEKYDRLIAHGLTPIKRWGKPEDVAKAVVAIAEDYFPFSTGEVINVDGGFHIHRL